MKSLHHFARRCERSIPVMLFGRPAFDNPGQGRYHIFMMKSFKELQSVKELEHAIAESSRRPVLLFKHSLTCPISARAFNEFQSFMAENGSEVGGHLITVQTARLLSNEVSDRFGIPHESPQAILLRNGRAVWNDSHFAITAAALQAATQTSKGNLGQDG